MSSLPDSLLSCSSEAVTDPYSTPADREVYVKIVLFARWSFAPDHTLLGEGLVVDMCIVKPFSKPGYLVGS
jgi:hypothetical protein